MDKNATGTSLPNQTEPSKKPLHVVRLDVPEFSTDEQQRGPSLGPVYSIHRGPDGFVSLGSKPDGEWRELGAMNLSQPFLPGLVAHLASDAYFGLNTAYRTGFRFSTREEWRPIPGENHGEQLVPRTIRERTVRATGLPYAAHELKNLRWLNVCHADIDCYKAGLSVGEALGQVVDLQDAGRIPPATAFVRSGRGLWLLWFLVDAMNPTRGTRELYGAMHTPDTPQRASARALALYAKVQRAIADTLAPLGADIGALDAARFAPVPGTMKTAAGQRVVYWLQLDSQRKAFGYTLASLARALDVPTSKTEHPVIVAALTPTPTDAPKDATLSAAGRRGWLTRWRNALADYVTLLNLRGGGFQDGQNRHRGAFFYALLLSRSGMPWADVEARVAAFGARCTPALTAQETRAAVRQARKPKGASGYLSNGTLLAELHVTDTEASYLQFLKPKPKALAPTKATTQQRRDAVRYLVAQLRRIPSPREMARHLAPLGLGDNFTTIWRDYKALGYHVPRKQAKGGRPPKLPY